MKPRIPTIMYHSIGVTNYQWHWNFLTCPYEVFENQLKWLKKFNYYTANFQEVYDYIMRDKPLPKNTVFLNFDDGYLDNYVYAYPLLKKFGMKGTVFVNPDFVDKSTGLRKTMNDAKTEAELKDLPSIGFCNWDELKKMDSEGIIEAQSHAKTHTWYPVSDKILDFRHPGDDYIWMDWNEYPDEKPLLQITNPKKVKLGKAIFEHEKAMSSKRVTINENFQNELNTFVMSNGNEDFFKSPSWKNTLKEYSERLKKKYVVVKHEETDNEYYERVKYELGFTKLELEKKLNKEVLFLCWPGGSATKMGMKIATELGYLMSTAARDLSNEERKKIVNTPDYKINRISRFTPVLYNNWQSKQTGRIKYSPGWFFILQLTKFQNKYGAKYWGKLVVATIIKFAKFNDKKNK